MASKSKRLVFQDSDDGRELFQYLYDGVILGASRGQAKSKPDIRLEATLQRRLQTISVVATDFDPRTRPVNARDLQTGHGPQTIDLSAAEMELIDKLLQAVPWGGAQSIPVADLFDFLSLAPDSQDETVEKA